MASKEKYFTLTWKVENISYCFQKKGAAIKSPSFVVGSTDETRWHLRLYPRDGEKGNYIGLYLFNKKVGKLSEPLKINYDIAFVREDGSTLTSKYSVKNDDSEYQSVGCPEFEKWEEIFISKRSTYLPQDTLTVRCRIWKCAGDMTEDVHCLARTRIEIQKISFVWNVKNFSTLESENKCTYLIKSIENAALLLSVDLSLTGGLSSEQIIRFEMSLRNRTMMFLSLRLSLVDASGNKIECNQEEIWFDDQSKYKEFKLSFTKNKLMALKSSYLPNDTLSMHWESTFSDRVTKIFEDIEYACAGSKDKVSSAQSVNKHEMVALPNILNYNLKSLHDEKFLCDVELKTSTTSFPAHRVILCATSLVFKAMFSSNMKEKYTNCINIEDLSDETVRRMLLYIYTARMEDATWESAFHLYVAADKYAILSLKNLCSSYLKENLSPTNACEILLLSNSHCDVDLINAVQEYIVRHGTMTIHSIGWKNLMKTNPTLAAETLSLLYK